MIKHDITTCFYGLLHLQICLLRQKIVLVYLIAYEDHFDIHSNEFRHPKDYRWTAWRLEILLKIKHFHFKSHFWISWLNGWNGIKIGVGPVMKFILVPKGDGSKLVVLFDEKQLANGFKARLIAIKCHESTMFGILKKKI